MRLPTLSVIVASQAIIWCIAGAAFHGPMILLYPLSWAVIAGAFYYHNKRNPIKLPALSVPSDEKWANSKKNNDAEGQQDDQNRQQKVGATK